MHVTPTAHPEVLIIQPRVFEDSRGHFFESFNQHQFEAATGCRRTFVQDNQSQSGHHVLRGLHYQVAQAQGKLVRVLAGEILDVAVDLRRSSPRFLQWVKVTLSHTTPQQLWVPEGFGHGFLVLSDTATVLYKTTDYYAPAAERTIRWNDPTIGIDWPTGAPVVSARDAMGVSLAEADLFP